MAVVSAYIFSKFVVQNIYPFLLDMKSYEHTTSILKMEQFFQAQELLAEQYNQSFSDGYSNVTPTVI